MIKHAGEFLRDPWAHVLTTHVLVDAGKCLGWCRKVYHLRMENWHRRLSFDASVKQILIDPRAFNKLMFSSDTEGGLRDSNEIENASNHEDDQSEKSLFQLCHIVFYEHDLHWKSPLMHKSRYTELQWRCTLCTGIISKVLHMLRNFAPSIYPNSFKIYIFFFQMADACL